MKKFTIILIYFLLFTFFFIKMSQADSSNYTEDVQLFDTEYKKINDLLKNKYNMIKKILSKNKNLEQDFVKAQEAWLNFSKKECQFESSRLGSAARLVYKNCTQELIKRRLKDFEYYLTCQEGDLSCPTNP